MSAIVLILAIATAVIDTPAIDGIDITQSVEHYTVSGTTGRRVLEEMQVLGPRDATTGRRNFGHTWAELNWSYGFSSATGGDCRIKDVQLGIDITITLPDWQPVRTPDRALQAQWQAFLDALINHELQHRAFAIETAKTIRDRLDAMPPIPCDAMEARVNDVTAPIMRRMADDNRAYDVRTEHGRTEGALWIAQ